MGPAFFLLPPRISEYRPLVNQICSIKKCSSDETLVYSAIYFSDDRVMLLYHQNSTSKRMKTRYDCKANERVIEDSDKVWLFNPRQ
ncbi:hypothetical protein TNCV_1401581 [Trichonephila clavipes]|nr:hypothetical protein TNCV_1401581 [Trichonephila clavipes]